MDHVAIMKKSWGFLPKILSGTKSIESRWYRNKALPWNKVQTGDRLYFKNSGELVTLSATVTAVLQFEDLTPVKVASILERYGRAMGIEEYELPLYYKHFHDKKYGILVFLEKAANVLPFDIDKKGFGSMAAWITIRNVDLIKK